MGSFTDIQKMANFANMITYPGTNPASLELVDPDILPWLPDPTREDACIENVDWWADKIESLTERYKEWQIS